PYLQGITYDEAVNPIPGRVQAPVTATLPGPTQGWRLLAAPSETARYDELLDGLWTQGFSGADTENGAANVYWFNTDSQAFEAPGSADALVGLPTAGGSENPLGRGILTYVYTDDVYQQPGSWPKTIGVDPPYNTEPLSVSYTTDAADTWLLAGNPFGQPLSWPALIADSEARTNLLDVMYVFDQNMNDGLGGYRVNFGEDNPNLPGALAHDGIIPPYQGFWIVSALPASSSSITFDPAFIAGESGTFYRTPSSTRELSEESRPSLQEAPIDVVMAVSGQELNEAAVLRIGAAAQQRVPRPTPLGPAPVSFGPITDEAAQPLLLYGTGINPGEQRRLPLSFNAVRSGSYTLELRGLEELPSEAEVQLELYDRHTGQRIVLDADAATYSFTHSPDAETLEQFTAARALGPREQLAAGSALKLATEARFELLLSSGTPLSNGPVDGELPEALALQQNYPNPFNPGTRIEYALPQDSRVRLEVFNLLGQRVALLVDEQQPAGFRQVNFDASALSSGVYIYRLQAGGQTLSQRMTLLK
ncbi:MAG: T9SS type A sorting domain-containing protein, partial [Cyclonatronaceae bacterium]